MTAPFYRVCSFLSKLAVYFSPGPSLSILARFVWLGMARNTFNFFRTSTPCLVQLTVGPASNRGGRVSLWAQFSYESQTPSCEQDLIVAPARSGEESPGGHPGAVRQLGRFLAGRDSLDAEGAEVPEEVA